MDRLKQFITEIHRRSLWQVLLIYCGGAWVCYEIIDTITDRLALPEWLPVLAIILFLIGLPVVMATAFVGELEAPSRAPAEAEAAAAQFETRRRHRLLTWRNAAATFVIVLAAWGVVAAGLLLFGGHGPTAAGETRKSIAVLPFENLSPDPDDAFFTDGIHEEIISQLGKIASLRVISRTSVMEYRDRDANLRTIADELGVTHVLEGSVRRAGDRVRVTTQLIAADEDAHLWAENYERQLRDIFAIQADVAREVTSALRAALTAEEIERIDAQPTEDPEAYDFYLRGKHFSFGDEQSIRIALDMYEHAVESDPGFALAYASLGDLHIRMYHEYYDHTPQRLALAKEAIDKALTLQPDLPAARLALGLYYYLGFLDYDRALEQFDIVLRTQPDNASALQYVSYVRRRQGDFEGARVLQERVLELDPRSPELLFNLAQTHAYLRNYEQAAAAYERAIALRPDVPSYYTWYAQALLLWQGSPDSARAVLEQATRRAGPADTDNDWVWTRINLVERDLDRALDRISQVPPIIDLRRLYCPSVLLIAEAHELLGSRDDAVAYYDSARALLEPKVLEYPEDARLHSALGVALAGLGLKEAAIREGRLGTELLPVGRDAFTGPSHLIDLARIYTIVGEYDSAIDQLDQLLSIPCYVSVTLLRVEPTWDPLRDHPRFQALLEKYER